jgi:hypothetical protein
MSGEEMREKLQQILCGACLEASGQYHTVFKECPSFPCDAMREDVDKILSLEINGYSIKQMVEFFSKINRETEREAVVRKEAELPPDEYSGLALAHYGQERRYFNLKESTYREAQQDMLSQGFVKEVPQKA